VSEDKRPSPRGQPDDYPWRITTGSDTARQGITWEIAPGHVLLTFERDAQPGDIDRVIGSLDSKSVPVHPRLYPDAADPLTGANMRWLYLPELDDPDLPLAELFERLNALLDAFGGILRSVTPIYRVEGTTVEETAAAPIPQRLLARLTVERPDAVQRLADERGLDIRDITLGPLDDKNAERLATRLGLKSVGELRERLPTVVQLTNPDPRLSGFDLLAELDALGEEVAGVECDWRSLQTWLRSGSGSLPLSPGWNLDAIHAPDAWATTQGDPAVMVAQLDSGFDLAHADLSPGYADASQHFNAEAWAVAGGPPSSGLYDVSCAPMGDDGHGTATTGIVGASHLVGTDVHGVAPGCTLLPIALGLVPTSVEVGGGLLWAAAQGALVANMSLETVGLSYTSDALDLAWDAGMVLCAAAGNRGGATNSLPLPFPAWHPRVVAVGAAMDADGRRRAPLADGDWGSQFGFELSVVAPGVSCLTTDVTGSGGFDAVSDFITDAQATSIATPHVSGLAALIFSANPARTNAQVRSAIEGSARLFADYQVEAQAHGPASRPWHPEVGYGLIDCAAALDAATLMDFSSDPETDTDPDTDTEGNMSGTEGSATPSGVTDAEVMAIDALVATVHGSNARCLHGYLFKPEKGYTVASGPPTGGRLFLNADLDEWLDIPKGGIVRLHFYPQPETPHRGVVLWVDNGAQLEHVRRRGVSDFLSGSIVDGSSAGLGNIDLLAELLAELTDGASTSGYSTVRGPCRGYSTVRGPCRGYSTVRGPC